jgi:hypothetical protein
MSSLMLIFCIIQEIETVTLGLLQYFASTEMAVQIQKMAEKPYQKAFIIANVCILQHSQPT